MIVLPNILESPVNERKRPRRQRRNQKRNTRRDSKQSALKDPHALEKANRRLLGKQSVPNRDSIRFGSRITATARQTLQRRKGDLRLIDGGWRNHQFRVAAT